MGLDHKADSFTAWLKSQRVQHSELRTGVSQPTDTLLGDRQASTSQQIQFRRTQKGSWSWELYNTQAPEKYTNWVRMGSLSSTIQCAPAQLSDTISHTIKFVISCLSQ